MTQLATIGTVTLARASESDLPGIVSLIADDPIARSRGDVEADLGPYATAFEAIDADPSELLVAAHDGSGNVVGTMQLSFLPNLSRRGATRLQIEAVRVAESERGTGLGSAMITWALDEGRRRDCELAQLTSDQARPDAHRFYEKLGFVASHTGFKKSL